MCALKTGKYSIENGDGRTEPYRFRSAYSSVLSSFFCRMRVVILNLYDERENESACQVSRVNHGIIASVKRASHASVCSKMTSACHNYIKLRQLLISCAGTSDVHIASCCVDVAPSSSITTTGKRAHKFSAMRRDCDVTNIVVLLSQDFEAKIFYVADLSLLSRGVKNAGPSILCAI